MIVSYDAREDFCYLYGLSMPARDGYVLLRSLRERSISDSWWLVPGTLDLEEAS